MTHVAPKGRKHLSADALLHVVRSGLASLPDHRLAETAISFTDALMSAFGHCSKDSVSGVSPAFPVQRLSGVVSAFGTGFPDHVQGDTTFSTDLATDPVYTLLHRAMTPIAPLHRIGGRRQQRVVQKRQGFFQMRREDLL